MANKYKGEISVLLDGEEHILKYDMNSMVEIEERLGVTGLEAILEKLRSIDFKTLRLLLWAGLIHAYMDDNEQPTLKVTDVGKMKFNMVDTIEKVAEAVQLGMGIEQDDTAPNRPSRAAKPKSKAAASK